MEMGSYIEISSPKISCLTQEDISESPISVLQEYGDQIMPVIPAELLVIWVQLQKNFKLIPVAPEVMCRQNHGVAVDYYAVGVIAYECMLGKVFALDNRMIDILIETISGKK